ncbi:DUF2007 domain-containing protein [Flagellimonas nanhaiensis]|uniref:DUF2007 domain-containing protein n=1 Tax=Flagellimonas nanhaiensis TaxID=2292706 RepID=A0A371JQ14_9FLAO|nr:DUF2007 domain-containing protein [Allomuricauda nanhaiensis]RDY59571.1 DUF2007 domain-containing protein [Allomuricauda nanhaiensis]
MGKDWVILGTFEFLADVQIIKGKLESEGIEVRLKDDNTVSVEPFASNALGGVKLMVHRYDEKEAKAIYNEIRNYATDKDGNLIVCPICGAQKSEVYYARKTILYKLFPFLEPKKYKCNNCNFLTKAKK